MYLHFVSFPKSKIAQVLDNWTRDNDVFVLFSGYRSYRRTEEDRSDLGVFCFSIKMNGSSFELAKAPKIFLAPATYCHFTR